MALPDQLRSHSVHGYNLVKTLRKWQHVERTCDVLEIWAGVGSVASAARKLSLSAREIELLRVPGTTDDPTNKETEDLMSEQGVANALEALMSVKVGGLVMMGPVCSSMVFMNSSRCCRTFDNVWGDVTYAPVQEGNHFANCMVLFLLVSDARGLHAVCEQPKGSMLWNLPPVRLALDHLQLISTLTPRCAFDRKPFGQRFLKVFKLYGPSWILDMHRTCKCPNGKHQALVKTSANGSVTGIHDALTESGAYPKAMGHALVRSWLKGLGAAAPLLNQKGQKRKASSEPVIKKPAACGSLGSCWKQPPLSL